MPLSADLYRAVFQNSSIGMAVVRANGEIVLSNPAFSEVSGHTGSNGSGAFLWDLINEADRGSSKARLEELSHPGERYNWAVRSDAGRRAKVWQLDVSVIGHEQGRPLLLVNVRDVTLQKTTERRLKGAKESAERATKTKSDFLANMSHEIRTPIHTITGVNELLLDTELDAEQQEYAEQVGFSAEVLLGLVNDILDFSKIEAGKLVLESIAFPLITTTEDAVDMLSLEAHRKGLEAIISVGTGIPERVIGDPGRVRQIIVNLFNNAVKFTPGGQILLSLTVVSIDAATVRVRFEVTDSGIGIPREKLNRLFKAFHQVDESTSRKFGGTGLGLSICQSLVTMMGGTLGVESEEGRGSTFWFEIPFPVVEQAVALEQVCAGQSVLLIDDNDVSRRVLQDYLERMGGTVSTAVTGSDALEALRDAAASQEPFDLALVDLELPGMDGWQLASEINADKGINATALILLTPTGKMGGDAKMKRLLWFNGYANKPVRIAEITKQIGNALASELELAEAEDTELVEEVVQEAAAPALRLVVAEDHMVNQQLFRTILEKLGHTVILASNGTEAVGAVEKSSPDLVFMDVQMPVMNGYEATEAIRSRGFTVPIVAVTANALKGERDKCLAVGMNDFLTKPFKKDDIAPILDRWVTSNTNPTVADVAGGEEVDNSAADVPIFDTEAAIERFMGQSAVVARVAHEFVQKCRESVVQLEVFLAEGAWEDLRREAHGIKGGAWNLEARRVGSVAAELESAATENDADRCRQWLTALPIQVEGLAAAVESFLEQQ